jgi:hypothetical protein
LAGPCDWACADMSNAFRCKLLTVHAALIISFCTLLSISYTTLLTTQCSSLISSRDSATLAAVWIRNWLQCAPTDPPLQVFVLFGSPFICKPYKYVQQWWLEIFHTLYTTLLHSIKPSQPAPFSLAVSRKRLPTADVPLALGSRAVHAPRPQQQLTSSDPQRKQRLSLSID